MTLVFSVDEDGFEWGYLGVERKLPIASVREIHWNEWKGDSGDSDFSLTIKRQSGGFARIWTVGLLFSREEDRGQLLSYLRETFPAVPFKGSISRLTELSATRKLRNRWEK